MYIYTCMYVCDDNPGERDNARESYQMFAPKAIRTYIYIRVYMYVYVHICDDNLERDNAR